jgi:hypothetical protein
MKDGYNVDQVTFDRHRWRDGDVVRTMFLGQTHDGICEFEANL